MSKVKKQFTEKVETFLSAEEHEKFLSLCEQQGQTRSVMAREAIKAYLDYLDELKDRKRQAEIAQSISNSTDHICAMLARQGTQIGTLFELAWRKHLECNNEPRFITAVDFVKNKMRKRLEEDQKNIDARKNDSACKT